MHNTRVELLPIFDDNYIFVLINEDLQSAVVVDPGESAAAEDFLLKHDLTLAGILLTHHHADHIGGVHALKTRFPCPVYAPVKNKTQIPFADHYLREGDIVTLPPFSFQVLELPGHTLGHIAYWNSEHKWLFSGDVIFGLGCGRLFEGSYEEAFHSLQRIKALPPESLIYCSHEYTQSNLQFCRSLSADNNSPLSGKAMPLEAYATELHNKRSHQLPSVPLKLGIEVTANPFLLARDVAQFRYLRDLRNRF